jgi:hypothetical protein
MVLSKLEIKKLLQAFNLFSKEQILEVLELLKKFIKEKFKC